MKSLEKWYQQIKGFEKLSLAEAKESIYKADNCENEELKKYYYDKVILGTLYVVYNHVKNNAFEVLNNSLYDIDDIINTCNELWIKEIKSGELLKVKNFGEIFFGRFYGDLSRILALRISEIRIETCTNEEKFAKLFNSYLILKNESLMVDFKDFYNFMNIKFSSFVNSNSKADIKRLFDVFNQMYDNMNVDKLEKYDFSDTRLDHFKYLLISNSLEEKLNSDFIDEFDLENMIIDRIYFDDFINTIEKSKLKDFQINLLYDRFGLYGKEKSLNDLAITYNMSIEGVRKSINKSLKKLSNMKKIKNLIR